MITLSLAIPHTPWIPERCISLQELYSALPRPWPGPMQVFQDREPNHIWSRKMWGWSLAQNTTHCVFLQDDTLVSPTFVPDLLGIIDAHPSGVLGLQVAHPAAPALFEEGYKGFTTNDALVGVGYCLPWGLLNDFLTWCENLPDGANEAITEDTKLGLWCAATGRKIFHPLPTIVDHNTNVASTYKNDDHPNRHSRVRWDTPPPNWEAPIQRTIPHLGCFYESTPRLCAEIGISAQRVKELRADNGQTDTRRIAYARKARADVGKHKVLVAIPSRGELHPECVATVWRLLKDEEIDLQGDTEIIDIAQWSYDVVRARSAYVTHFLEDTNADRLLFLDADIAAVNGVAIKRMLALMGERDKHFIAAPYPYRDKIDYERVRNNPTVAPEGVAYRYPVQSIDGNLSIQPNGLAEIAAIGLGCAVLSREGLQRMTDSYRDLIYIDKDDREITALFQLILADKRLWSEDYSFCKRWRAIGEKIWLYLGPGSPVDHWGSVAFRGNVEAFGVKRVTR